MDRNRTRSLFRRVMIGCAAVLACAQAFAAIRLVGAGLQRAPSALADVLSFGSAPGARALAPAGVGELPARTTGLPDERAGEPADSAALPEVEAPEEDPFRAPSCAGVSALIVTELRSAGDSMALLHDARGTSQRRVGERFREKRVAAIGFNPRESSPSVWLSGSDGLCQVILFPTAGSHADERPSQVSVEDAVAEPRREGAGGEPEAVLGRVVRHIRKTSATEFDVDRSAVELILEHQAELMRNVRIVPEHKEGKVVGPRLFGVRSDGVLAALGLENGDRVESINGFSLQTPEGALEAYARLRTTDSLSVRIQRRGQAVALDYRIR